MYYAVNPDDYSGISSITTPTYSNIITPENSNDGFALFANNNNNNNNNHPENSKTSKGDNIEPSELELQRVELVSEIFPQNDRFFTPSSSPSSFLSISVN